MASSSVSMFTVYILSRIYLCIYIEIYMFNRQFRNFGKKIPFQ
ncbi:unnamed protein product [Brassica rapa subsp. narinosa]